MAILLILSISKTNKEYIDEAAYIEFKHIYINKKPKEERTQGRLICGAHDMIVIWLWSCGRYKRVSSNNPPLSLQGHTYTLWWPQIFTRKGLFLVSSIFIFSHLARWFEVGD